MQFKYVKDNWCLGTLLQQFKNSHEPTDYNVSPPI